MVGALNNGLDVKSLYRIVSLVGWLHVSSHQKREGRIASIKKKIIMEASGVRKLN